MSASFETNSPEIVAPQILLSNHLKALKLPTFAREYEKVAMESASDRADYPRYLLRLCELERIDRERRNVERRIRLARFSQIKSLDSFDFSAQPSLNKPLWCTNSWKRVMNGAYDRCKNISTPSNY